jgi:hypothetical protein
VPPRTYKTDVVLKKIIPEWPGVVKVFVAMAKII